MTPREPADASDGRAQWREVAEWWSREIEADPAYGTDVMPLVEALTAGLAGTVLDLGCGEGRVMRALEDPGRRIFGTDSTGALLRHAAGAGPVVEAVLPGLAWVRSGALDAAYAVLVVEHLVDLDTFFAETARVVRRGGALIVVMNHPAFTTPGSGPVVDPADGEVFWRWGAYFDEGSSLEPAGSGRITFHHRSMGRILGSAAAAGWVLVELVERAASGAVLEGLPGDQRHIPRLLGIRWRR